jgi:NAD-dependent dihydropyrimidine dehydrogenase PreA subunit
MSIAPIDIWFFSGTGNTLRAVRRLQETLERLGVATRRFRLERSVPGQVDLDRVLGLAFPVAVQSTYPFVWDFIRRLPEARGTPVFMLDTLHAFSGGIVGPLRRQLRRKGYAPIGAIEVRMPNNFFPGRSKPGRNERIIEAGLAHVDAFAQHLVTGQARWRRVPVFSDLPWLISTRAGAWPLLRRVLPLAVDGEKCTRCGTCAKLCPVENIAMEGKPRFLARCQLCMRCVSFCPTGAIRCPRRRFEPYRAATAAELLNEDSRT